MKLTHKQKKMLIRIISALVLLAAAMLISHIVALPKAALVVIFLIPFAIAGYDVVFKAVRNIGHGQVFDENFLMTVATIGAMIIGEYSEGAAVMLFYQVGELFQSIATAKSRKNIAELMDIRPDSAVVLRDGERKELHPSEVNIGERIEVHPGEKVPLDGIVVDGESTLDTSALTGESLPSEAVAGTEILSGCVNLSGTITVKVQKPFGESTVSKILELVETASSKKARTENFITRFARIYTPAVVGAAVLLAVIPPLVTGSGWAMWITRALTFLVVSCPCALVISVPMSFFGGIGGASKQGILIKGGNYMETLAKANTIIFDKTGTLTKGSFSVARVDPYGCKENELIKLAASAESESNHPIAKSLVEKAQEMGIEPLEVKDYREIAGKGVSCTLNGRKICAGNFDFIAESCQTVTQERIGIGSDLRALAVLSKTVNEGTVVYVSCDGKFMGALEISDMLKSDSAKAIKSLKSMGIKTIMLTGDNNAAAKSAAQGLEIDELHAELLPEQKVEYAEEIISQANGATAFVGDGINDAPVLSRADVGIAMGAAGSDAAIEAADIVLMNDNPSAIAEAIKISKKTIRIVYQNISFALGIKAVVLVTSALGFTNMWLAVFADVGVAILAILNAMRAGRVKK